MKTKKFVVTYRHPRVGLGNTFLLGKDVADVRQKLSNTEWLDGSEFLNIMAQGDMALAEAYDASRKACGLPSLTAGR